jgi:hypothetical protein
LTIEYLLKYGIISPNGYYFLLVNYVCVEIHIFCVIKGSKLIATLKKTQKTIKILDFNGAGFIPVSEKSQGNKKNLHRSFNY